MDFPAESTEGRFAAYVEGLVSVIGHADRARPLRDYCVGLMTSCERNAAVRRLGRLLMEAAGVDPKEIGDDER